MTESDQKAMAGRLQHFRKEIAGLKQLTAITESGFSNKAISFAENGKSKISQRLIDFYVRNYRMNADWLMTGQGSPTIEGRLVKKDSAMERMASRIEDLEKQVLKLAKEIEQLKNTRT